MDNMGRDENIKTKKKGILYFLKRFFNFLPVKTDIKTSSDTYDIEIRITGRRMKKIVDEICLRAISSL